MLAVVSRLFFFKSIARRLLRNFADNLQKYKANFLWWFPTNLKVFIICEGNYSYQFRYFKKKFPNEIQSEEKADRKKTYAERTDYVSHIFINFVYFLIFADKSWFIVKSLFIYLLIHVYF